MDQYGTVMIARLAAAPEDVDADYRALADDPAQDDWWREKVMPMLDGDPQWFDGHWRMSIDAA
jgi:hypothetical protein